MNDIVIRREEEKDYRIVEEIHRNAFWNLHVPGCDEHYIAHILRDKEDFIPELDLVLELDGKVIANVMYTKSQLVDEQGNVREILTFGPIGVEPEYQRRGAGKALLERSFEIAIELGYKVIAIFGNPGNYVARGFKSCKKYNVCVEGDVFPAALLVKELEEGFFDGRKYYFQESAAFDINPEEIELFEQNFEAKEKRFQPSQEEFYIHSHSVIRE